MDPAALGVKAAANDKKKDGNRFQTMLSKFTDVFCGWVATVATQPHKRM